MQQTLAGCAFCDALPGTKAGEEHTWGKDKRVSHPSCVDCAIQAEPDPDDRDHCICDGCGLVVDTILLCSPIGKYRRRRYRQDQRSICYLPRTVYEVQRISSTIETTLSY